MSVASLEYGYHCQYNYYFERNYQLLFTQLSTAQEKKAIPLSYTVSRATLFLVNTVTKCNEIGGLRSLDPTQSIAL